MEEDYIKVIKITVLGVISWGLLFILIRRIFSRFSFEFSTHLASTLHGTIAVSLATRSVKNWSCPVCPNAASSLSVQQMETMAFSISYMIYGLIFSHFDKVIRIDNLIHHSICIIGFVAVLYYRQCGSETMAAIWITEITSPLLHLRSILEEFGYRNTDLNFAVDVCFATIFTLARMVAGPYLIYVIESADYPILIKAIGWGLQLLSAFWFYKIFKIMRYKVNKGSMLNKKFA